MSTEDPRTPTRPLPAVVAPTLAPIKSCWRSGTLTFGPIGRVVWTFVASVPGLWLAHHIWRHGLLPRDDLGALVVQLFGAVFVVTWMGWIWPRALKDIWARQVVYVPQPHRSPVELLTDRGGSQVVTLASFVAKAQASHGVVEDE